MSLQSLLSNVRVKLCLLLLAAGIGASFLPVREFDVISPAARWVVKDNFAQSGVYPSTEFEPEVSKRERDTLLWGSWCGGDAKTGELLSPPFRAPLLLQVLLAGYPEKPGISILLEKEDGGERIALHTGSVSPPGEHWRKVTWLVPGNLRGARVRLRAIDNATGSGGWVGVSTPRRISASGFLVRQLRPALIVLGVFLFDFALFLLPGIAFTSVFASRHPALRNSLLLLVIFAVSATLGYISFWAFFQSKLLGRLFTFSVYLLSLGVFATGRNRKSAQRVLKFVGEPLSYATVAGICYLSFVFLWVNPLSASAGYVGTRFFDQIRPGDNVIPFIFAEKIYNRLPLHPFCCGDWLSSDRPPLQSGIFLLERPLGLLHNKELDYELLSIGLQCLWTCAVWYLLTAAGTSKMNVRRALAVLICSGFLFYNSVYTWPKLLASAGILFVVGILVELVRENRPLTPFEGIVASSCLGLALMAHPGSVFSLFGFALAALFFRRLLPIRSLLVGGLVLACYMLPWSAYQKFVDPPGNRLLKMHLAAQGNIDSRSTMEALRDAYRSYPLAEIVRLKESNLVLLAGHKPLESYGLRDLDLRNGSVHIEHAAAESSRIAQREWIWNAIGPINLGWLGLLLIQFRRKRQAAVPFAGWFMLLAALNLVFWSLITFGPDETVTTHSSYADILLLQIGLLSFALPFPKSLLPITLGLQIFNLIVVWIWISPLASFGAGNILPIASQVPLLTLGGSLLLAMLWHSFRQRTQ